MNRLAAFLAGYRLNLLPEPEPTPADPVLPWFFWTLLSGVLAVVAALGLLTVLLIRRGKKKKAVAVSQDPAEEEERL